jgi:hypothetical protein
MSPWTDEDAVERVVNEVLEAQNEVDGNGQ